MKKSWNDLLKEGQEQLDAAGVPESSLDARYLLEEAFQVSRSYVLLHGMEEIPYSYVEDGSLKRYRRWITKRAERVPLQQILGYQEFCGLRFTVNDQVLIPRQDTEVLVELVMRDYPRQKAEHARVLDLCTGSGCILLSLLELGHFERGLGIDLSDEALKVAVQNQKGLHIEHAAFQKSDLFEKVQEREWDVIVSNPPYIAESERPELMPEVAEHEPEMALFAPENGLAFYRRLAETSGNYLKRGGRIYLEIGCTQGEAVKQMLQEHGFSEVQVCPDYAGLDRVVTGIWK